MSEFDFDHIMSEIPSNEATGVSLASAEEIMAELEEYMSTSKWKAVSKTLLADGDIAYDANFSINGRAMRSTVIIEATSQAIRIVVTLPAKCMPEYGLIMAEYVTNFNYTKRFGTLQHDTRDGNIEYTYAYSYAEGFKVKTFDVYFNSCLFTAADACQEVDRLCVGRLSRRQLAELNEKLNRLVNALKE
ncbi:MAG: hypothetical protein LBC41_11940 [Clostridiales bacterium]|jgi:hypothetical protein|nr:hypothetical protein [Clostridiales bacterium]MDR2751363.1 hypothetical protein [Clostridiales bacterium]